MKDGKLVIYLSVPLSGLSYKEAEARIQSWAVPLHQMGFHVLDPLAGKSYLADEKKLKKKGYLQPASTNHGIFEKDKFTVQMSDILIVDLRGTSHVHIGCVFELCWGNYLGKLNIVLMEKENNIHDHAFVGQAASFIYQQQEDVLEYLKDLARRF